MKYLIAFLILLSLSVNSYADTTKVNDTFTEASTIDLATHVPSPTGTSWTEDFDDCTSNYVDDGTDDNARPTTDALTCQMRYTTKPDSTQAEYYVESNFVDRGTVDITAVAAMIGRCIDCNSLSLGDYYVVSSLDDNDTAYRLDKIIDGVPTSLGTGGGFQNTANEVIKLELKDATKKVFEAGTERISSTDNVITGIGEAGLACGEIDGTTTKRCDNGVGNDNYSVVEITAAGIGTGTLRFINWLDKLIPNAFGQTPIVRDGRWYISPVVKQNGVRMPKAQTIPDPGRPLLEDDLGTFTIPDYCRMSNIIGNFDVANEWTLSYVSCVDYTALGADPDIIFVSDEKIDALTTKLSSLSASKRNKLKQVIESKTGTTNLTNANTIEEWLEVAGKLINPQFKARSTFAR